MKLVTLNLKGGVGKTTSALFLAAELAKRGKTLLVDADPQGSALSWSEQAGQRGEDLPFDVVSLPVKDIHKRLKTLATAFDHVVIDTPPGHIEIVQSALLAADIALIPLSTSLMEIDRMSPALQVIASVENVKPELEVRMLFTRVRRTTNSYKAAREYFATVGFPILDTEIPLRESYNVAFGAKPGKSPEYEDVLHELFGEPCAWAHILRPASDTSSSGQVVSSPPAVTVEAPSSAVTAAHSPEPPAAVIEESEPVASEEPVEPAQALADEVATREPLPTVAVELPELPSSPLDTMRPPAAEPVVEAAPIEVEEAPAEEEEPARAYAPFEDPFVEGAEEEPESEKPTAEPAPRRRAQGAQGEMDAFTPDPLSKVFGSDEDESARPPFLRR